MYRSKRFIWIVIPGILLFKPLWNLLQRLYYESWDVLRNVVSYFESNPLITLLVVIIIYLANKR